MKDHLFETFCKERNYSPGSINVYSHAIKRYIEFNEMTLEELLSEAEREEDEKLPWRKRALKSRLTDFRQYLIDYGYSSTKMLDRVMTFYRHFFIEIHNIPKTNYKKISEVKIPTKEDLQKAIEISDPLMVALIEFLVETGLSKVDALKLTIKDFIESTKQYHNCEDIYELLDILSKRDDVVATFYLMRSKTKKWHYTFAGPEAIIAIVNYLLTRKDKLTDDSKLFDISYHWLTEKFEDLNETLGLGVTEGNGYCVLRCHTLRKYHATTLRDDGLDKDIVNSLQGKAKNKVDAAYFIDTAEPLRKRYIEHMDCLCLTMEVKSIDIKSEDYLRLERENKKYKEVVESIDERIERKVNEALSNSSGPLSDDEFEELFS